jgi:hypothetical protein
MQGEIVIINTVWFRNFFKVPVDGMMLSGHDEVVQMDQVPIDGRELSCHDEVVQMASKKKAPARRPAALLTLSREQDHPGARSLISYDEFSHKCFG